MHVYRQSVMNMGQQKMASEIRNQYDVAGAASWFNWGKLDEAFRLDVLKGIAGSAKQFTPFFGENTINPNLAETSSQAPIALRVTVNGQSIEVTDPVVIQLLSTAIESGNTQDVGTILGLSVLGLVESPNGADGDSFENTSIAPSDGGDYQVDFDHEYFIFDFDAGAIAAADHYSVTVDFDYPAVVEPVVGTTVGLADGREIEVVLNGLTLTADETIALQNFDWVGAGGGSGRQFIDKLREGLGDELTDKLLSIDVIKDGAVTEGGLFAALLPDHSTGLSPYGWLGIDGAGIGADIFAILGVPPVSAEGYVANVSGPQGSFQIDVGDAQDPEAAARQIEDYVLNSIEAADPTQRVKGPRSKPVVDNQDGTYSVEISVTTEAGITSNANYTFEFEGVQHESYTASVTSSTGAAFEVGIGNASLPATHDAVADEIRANAPGIGLDPITGDRNGGLYLEAPIQNADGSYDVTARRTVQDGETGAVSVETTTYNYTLTDPSQDGRRLRQVDGEVTGSTEEEVAFDASSERVAVLWQGLVSIAGGEVPNMSPNEVFSYAAGVYLGADVQFTDEQMASFFEKNLDANGNLSTTLDLSMFEGVDPTLLQQVFTDGAQLFHSIQANSPASAGTDGPSLIFAPTQQGAEETFANALRTDILHTGTTAAASDTQWQDFLASGIYSKDSVLNGDFTPEDLSNDSLVKALLWVGSDVIGELQAKGLWDGPSAAELDSPTLVDDHPIYDVIYIPAGETESVHVLAGQEEFDALVQQHKDGKITFQTDNILSSYVSDPVDSEVGANEFKLTYIDNATGETVVLNEVSQSQHDALVTRHQNGEIIIVPPKLEDPNQVKLIWAEKAIAVYDATQEPVYDAKGNVVSGGDATARIAQAYTLYYEHNAPATETESYGPNRTGTRLDPLLMGGPDATTSSMNDADAINFMFNTTGQSNGNNDIYSAFSGVKGITDIVHVAGHWAQDRVTHPDHTFGEWLGGGNKDQAQTAADKVEGSLGERGRSSGIVEAAVADTDQEIDQSRVLTALNTAFVVVTLGADAAVLAAADVTATELGVTFTSDEGVNLLEQSFQTLTRAGRSPTLKDALFELVENGNLSKEQAVQILARQSGSDAGFWQSLGANGAGYATAGAVGAIIGQSGVSGEVVPISNNQGTLPTVTDEAGLTINEHLDAISLASQTVAMSKNVGIEAAGAFLFGDHGYSPAVVEQALELLPPDVQNELIAYRDGFTDNAQLSSLIAAGDLEGVAAYIEGLPSAAQQYDALVAVLNAGGQVMAFQVLTALPEGVAANILIYEQSANLNSLETASGAPADPLDTSGPVINALFDLASVQPEAFQEDFGAIFAKVAEISPDLGAHILYTALRFRAAPDGTGNDVDLAATILTSVDEGSALQLLNSLDELEADNGPRRNLGESSSQFQWASLSILAAIMRNTGDITLTFKHELNGDYQTGDLSVGPIADYAATSTEAKSQVDRLNDYIFNPFAAFSDPDDGAELGEYALLAYGYDNAAQRLNDMSPEDAAKYLDQVSPATFQKLIAGMDVDKALAAQPYLAASQNVLQGTDREEFVQRLADLTGVDSALITGLFDGTMTLEDMAQNEAYSVIPTLFGLVQNGDADAIQFLNDGVDKLIAAGGSGAPDDPGGWDANELAILDDLRDGATGKDAYADAPSAEAQSTLLQLLSGGLGAAFEIVSQLADLKFVPEAVTDMGLDGLIEQNPELAGLFDNYEEVQAAYLTQINGTDEGRQLLESYGYQVIDGELYYAPRDLQNVTDNPSGSPSGVPSESPSWHPSLRPSNPPSGAPSGNPSGVPSGAPVKVSAAEAESFFQEHGRLDLAVEVSLFVGEGATVRQFRVFITLPVSKDEFDNGEWGFRLRQLTAVAPEDTLGGAGNWASQTTIGQLAGRGAAYVDDLLGNAPSAVGNSLLGVAQRFGLPERGSIWATDFGLVGVKDFAFSFLGPNAKGENGEDISGFKPNWSYRSSVNVATEAGNAENSLPYQLYNWVQGLRGGDGSTYSGTDIPRTEVVSYRHAVSNYNAAESAYNAATAEVSRQRGNGALLENRWTAYQTADQNFQIADAAENDSFLRLAAKGDELRLFGVDPSQGTTNSNALASAFRAAETNFAAADAARDAAQINLDSLINDGNDPNSAVVADATDDLNAAEQDVVTAQTNLDRVASIYTQSVSNPGVVAPELQTLLDEYAALTAEHADDVDTRLSALADSDAVYDQYVTQYSAFQDQNSDFGAATEAQTAAADVWNARGDQLGFVTGLTDGVNAAQRGFNLVTGNVDSESGVGYGWGAVYNNGSTDDTTGEFTKDNNVFWQAAGDITASVVGSKALSWSVQAYLTSQLGPAPTDAQQQGAVLEIAAAQEEAAGFFQQTLFPEAGSTKQGLGLLGSYVTSTIYTQVISGHYDNIVRASDIFGWAALQWRGKFTDQSFGFLGQYTGKAGGRFQVNLGQTLTTE